MGADTISPRMVVFASEAVFAFGHSNRKVRKASGSGSGTKNWRAAHRSSEKI
jgi:hypothetical protein